MPRDLYWAVAGLCVVSSMVWNDPAPKRAGEQPVVAPRGQVISGSAAAVFSALHAEGPGLSDLAESGPSTGASRGLGETLRERLRARREVRREGKNRSRETMRSAPEASSAPAGERLGELRKRLEDLVQQLRQRIQGTSSAPGAEGAALPEQRMPPILPDVPRPEKPDGSQTGQSNASKQFVPVGPELVIPGSSSAMEPAGSAVSPGLSKAGPSEIGPQSTDELAVHPTGEAKQWESAPAAGSQEEVKSKSPSQNGLGGWFTGMSQLFSKPAPPSNEKGKSNPKATQQKAQAEQETQKEAAARPLEKRSLSDIRREILTQQQSGQQK
jgi:hypothetical protein